MDTTAEPGLYVYIPFPVVGNVGGVRAGCGDLRCLPSEHCCKIYCDKDHCGNFSGGNTATRSSGIEILVGTVRII